jgi:hypothetical protein
MLVCNVPLTSLFAISVLAAPAAAQIVVVQAGRLPDRPGREPRGPSTIVIRNGREFSAAAL